jgi:signal transduction histidine kinase
LGRLRRLPLRVRLVVGFAGAMLVVLLAAGAFVVWRVQTALDHRLDQDLANQSADLTKAASAAAPAAALAAVASEGRDAQILDAGGRILASGPGISGGTALLTPEQARSARSRPLTAGRGTLFSGRGRHLRIRATPVGGPGPAAVAVTAVRLDQRDEALRELLAQLAIANLAALAIASFVGYRLAHAALDPVEDYRAQAERIAQGAAGVRLSVPVEPGDEIARLGATLNAMLDAQERAADRQRQFIDDASHELRTPLAVQAAEIDLALRKRRTAGEYEAALHRLATSTTRLVDLTEDLLALGALGSATPSAEDLDAGRLLRSAAQRARGQADGREVVVEARAGLLVHADPRLLERALGNLVDNAARHGGGRITLSAREDGAVVTLAVHDEGPGPSPGFLSHAAERFRQGDSARAETGTGLGLALVDAIATAHGGQLRICAEGHHHRQPTSHPELIEVACMHPDRGTTVTLLLTIAMPA